jgi:diadenosine tetraphosphatase ApaH/serine/threonine PP2A family protein phosphatase
MRFGLISDIHSNLAALEAVLKDLGKVDGLLCMGDIVGYGPQPNEVIERLREYKLFTILGNHDMAVLGLLELQEFNHDAIEANLWTREQLTKENWEWLESLKTKAKFNENVTLAHGSPLEPVWEYLTTPHAASRNFPEFDTPLCFVGHTHLPRLFRMLEGKRPGTNLPKVEMHIPDPGQTIIIGFGRLILNPGSVGQPRDGDSKASYALYDDIEETIVFKRVIYDIKRTQQLMQDQGLPQRLIMRLDYGL